MEKLADAHKQFGNCEALSVEHPAPAESLNSALVIPQTVLRQKVIDGEPLFARISVASVFQNPYAVDCSARKNTIKVPRLLAQFSQELQQIELMDNGIFNRCHKPMFMWFNYMYPLKNTPPPCGCESRRTIQCGGGL